ncbi:hypothetical protein EX30DRAFT_365528 [Ascodesmis nigricans]|uniref:Uncharacterized protein n=1 Tax=Ascodesmis nigricans TaxID=341454 RepID=A0A4V3SI73_9PEZI|nr:hypothetical protein EX30DRAFT_365528 [Ascodesmis nigricans]
MTLPLMPLTSVGFHEYVGNHESDHPSGECFHPIYHRQLGEERFPVWRRRFEVEGARRFTPVPLPLDGITEESTVAEILAAFSHHLHADWMEYEDEFTEYDDEDMASTNNIAATKSWQQQGYAGSEASKSGSAHVQGSQSPTSSFTSWLSPNHDLISRAPTPSSYTSLLEVERVHVPYTPPRLSSTMQFYGVQGAQPSGTPSLTNLTFHGDTPTPFSPETPQLGLHQELESLERRLAAMRSDAGVSDIQPEGTPTARYRAKKSFKSSMLLTPQKAKQLTTTTDSPSSTLSPPQPNNFLSRLKTVSRRSNPFSMSASSDTLSPPPSPHNPAMRILGGLSRSSSPSKSSSRYSSDLEQLIAEFNRNHKKALPALFATEPPESPARSPNRRRMKIGRGRHNRKGSKSSDTKKERGESKALVERIQDHEEVGHSSSESGRELQKENRGWARRMKHTLTPKRSMNFKAPQSEYTETK